MNRKNLDLEAKDSRYSQQNPFREDDLSKEGKKETLRSKRLTGFLDFLKKYKEVFYKTSNKNYGKGDTRGNLLIFCLENSNFGFFPDRF